MWLLIKIAELSGNIDVINKSKFLKFIGLAGVLLIVIHDLSTQAMTATGGTFAVICLCAITIGSVLQKNNPEMDLRTGSVIQFGVSIVPAFILTWVFGSFQVNITTTFMASMGWMTIVVSVIATCLYYKLLRDGSAVSVSSLFYLVPGVTAVISYFVFHEQLNIYIIAGLILVISSVVMTQNNFKIFKNKK